MRNAKFHRFLSRCALVAMLLLATVPTLGRLAQPAHPPAHPMAMAHGHAMPAGHDASDPLPVPHEHAQDCAYCALLPDTVLLPLLAAAIHPASAPAAPAMSIASALPVASHVSSLGARGPPRPS